MASRLDRIRNARKAKRITPRGRIKCWRRSSRDWFIRMIWASQKWRCTAWATSRTTYQRKVRQRCSRGICIRTASQSIARSTTVCRPTPHRSKPIGYSWAPQPSNSTKATATSASNSVAQILSSCKLVRTKCMIMNEDQVEKRSQHQRRPESSKAGGCGQCAETHCSENRLKISIDGIRTIFND